MVWTRLRPTLSADTQGPSGWRAYAYALLATSISTFAYLFALKRVVASDSTPGLDGVVTVVWTGGLVAPVMIAIKGLVLAAILWAGLALFDVKAAYTRCLAIAWSAEWLLVVPQLVYALVGFLRGATSRQDLYVPLGLDLVWKPPEIPLAVLSHSVSVFFIAWIAVVWSRLRRHTSADPRGWPAVVSTLVAAAVLILLPIVQLAP